MSAPTVTRGEYGQMQLQVRLAQVRLAQAMYWHALIVSGGYKSRRIFHGTETSGGTEFTEQEKLDDALRTMQRHIHLANELIDATEIAL